MQEYIEAIDFTADIRIIINLGLSGTQLAEIPDLTFDGFKTGDFSPVLRGSTQPCHLFVLSLLQNQLQGLPLLKAPAFGAQHLSRCL